MAKSRVLHSRARSVDVLPGSLAISDIQGRIIAAKALKPGEGESSQAATANEPHSMWSAMHPKTLMQLFSYHPNLTLELGFSVMSNREFVTHLVTIAPRAFGRHVQQMHWNISSTSARTHWHNVGYDSPIISQKFRPLVTDTLENTGSTDILGQATPRIQRLCRLIRRSNGILVKAEARQGLQGAIKEMIADRLTVVISIFIAVGKISRRVSLVRYPSQVSWRSK
ncbi:hypothetical protein Scep_019123 [Stephania cephalantha]|uniref:Uncharacterized protein n=1 Tax=Stephania cephalantha TaxID=152367 RepID=A0AAP0IA52_9MAGN